MINEWVITTHNKELAFVNKRAYNSGVVNNLTKLLRGQCNAHYRNEDIYA